MSEQPTDAEQDTARETEWSEGVEAYIRALPWSSDATDEVKTLVAGNIRAYAAHVRSALAQLTTERDHWRAEVQRVNALALEAAAKFEQEREAREALREVAADDDPRDGCAHSDEAKAALAKIAEVLPDE